MLSQFLRLGLTKKDVRKGEGVGPKAEIERGGCVNLALEISPKCGQGVSKTPNVYGGPLWMVP